MCAAGMATGQRSPPSMHAVSSALTTSAPPGMSAYKLGVGRPGRLRRRPHAVTERDRVGVRAQLIVERVVDRPWLLMSAMRAYCAT